MRFDPYRHHRRSIRLRGWDYSRPAVYFITCCLQPGQFECSRIENGRSILNDDGRIIDEAWRQLEVRFPNAYLDAYVIMPDHMHGILIVTPPGATRPRSSRVVAAHDDRTHSRGVDMGGAAVGARSPRPYDADPVGIGADTIPDATDRSDVDDQYGRQFRRPSALDKGRHSAPTLGQMIAYFKYRSTRRINARRGTPGQRIWQRNYYEHIVRDRDNFERVRRYILTNPVRWNGVVSEPIACYGPSFRYLNAEI